MFSCKVIFQGNFVFEMLMTMWTNFTMGNYMLSIYMHLDIGFIIGLIVTFYTLPISTSKIFHQIVYNI